MKILWSTRTGFCVSVGEAAAAKAKLCVNSMDYHGRVSRGVEPITDDLQDMNKFEFDAVTEQDIEKIVKHVPSNKAPGNDKVFARVLKDSLPATLPVITNVIIASCCPSVIGPTQGQFQY